MTNDILFLKFNVGCYRFTECYLLERFIAHYIYMYIYSMYKDKLQNCPLTNLNKYLR